MTPEEIVQKMLQKDYFSQWLGIKLLSVQNGKCSLEMTVTKDMLNGFGIAHGGVTYSFADSALAFASNCGGRQSVSIETSIAHVVSLNEGDQIVAEALLETESEKLGHYTVKVFLKNQPDKTVALFKGMVYRTRKNWEEND